MCLILSVAENCNKLGIYTKMPKLDKEPLDPKFVPGYKLPYTLTWPVKTTLFVIYIIRILLSVQYFAKNKWQQAVNYYNYHLSILITLFEEKPCTLFLPAYIRSRLTKDSCNSCSSSCWDQVFMKFMNSLNSGNY